MLEGIREIAHDGLDFRQGPQELQAIDHIPGCRVLRQPERVAKGGERFLVGKAPARLFRGGREVAHGPGGIAPLVEMPGQDPGGRLPLLSQHLFQGDSHAPVHLPPGGLEQRLVGHFLHRGMIEGVLAILLAVQQVHPGELLESLLDRLAAQHAGQDGRIERPTDDRRARDELPQIVGKTVKSAGDHAADGVRELQVRKRAGQNPRVFLFGQDALVGQAHDEG